MKRLVVIFLVLAAFALGGCTLDGFFSGIVNQPPEAVIDASATQGDAPLTVRFNAGYSHDDHSITDYYWDFGDPHDAAPLSTVAATHTYRYPGTYSVKLTVIDERGEMNAEKVAIVVVNPPPVASFSLSTDAPKVGETVSFDGSATYDSNSEVKTLAWDFGDGGKGSGQKVDHIYEKEGYYVITLTATDDEGASGTVRHAVDVQKSSGCGTGGGSSCGGGGTTLPLAVISGLPSCDGAKVGVVIHFDGSASRATSGGAIIRYEWELGDSTTASGATVDHAYGDPGYYQVSLTVTDEAGRSGYSAAYVYVYARSAGGSCS